MGFARGIERRLERLVDGLAARLFRGRIHPVELGTLLVREADLGIFETPGGWGVPNQFAVTMGGEPVDGEVLEAVQRELAAFVEESALERGWRLEGPAGVTVAVDPARRPAEVEIDATIVTGPRPVWARLKPVDGTSGPLDLAVNRAVIGRSSGSDVHVPNDGVSRTHAVIWQEAGSAWVGDLESSNGTFVNGERVHGPTPIVEGDLLTLGRTEFLIGRA
ncbi:MAG TPA: FhaA domain-containing protein [Acidimicrobiia bacterium]|nr:FhaA domain-containing protein [Acidimicrobiia bacterium]